MIRHITLAISLCLVFIFPAQLLGAPPDCSTSCTVYIDADITDTNVGSGTPDCSNYNLTTETCSGGSLDAYKTLDDYKAFKDSLSGGDTAYVYWNRTDTWTITENAERIRTKAGATMYLSAYKNANLDCSAWNETDDGYGALPIIDGQSAIMGGSINTGDVAPLDDSDTIKCLNIKNAYGICIQANDLTGTGPTITRNFVTKCGKACIQTYQSSDVTVTYNEVTQCGYGGDQGPMGTPIYSTHPGAISGPHTGTITYGRYIAFNHVYDSFSEAIHCGGQVCEYNFVGPSSSSGIYAERVPNGIIRFNVVYGAEPQTSGNVAACSDAWGGGDPDDCFRTFQASGWSYKWVSAGFNCDTEESDESMDNTKIYGNMAVSRAFGFGFRDGLPRESNNNISWIDNIAVSNGSNWYFYPNADDDGNDDYEVAGNISVTNDQGGDKKEYAHLYNGPGSESHMTIGPWYFGCLGSGCSDYTPSDGDWDDHSGTVKAQIVLGKISGWQSLTAYPDPLWDFFVESAQAKDPSNTSAPVLVHANDDCNGGSGCDTTMVVDDTYFFVENDYIAITSPNTIRQISSISHGTPGTLTLASGIDRDDGDSVWLPLNKWSSNTHSQNAGYYGSARDFGPIEFALDNAPTITSPSGPTGIAVDVTLAITRNNQINQTDFGLDAADHKICAGGGAGCDVCSDTGSGSAKKESSPLTHQVSPSLATATTYTYCSRTYVDWNADTVVDDEEAGAWKSYSFTTTAEGGPVGGVGKLYILQDTGTGQVETTPTIP